MRQFFIHAFVIVCVLCGLGGIADVCSAASPQRTIPRQVENETIEALVKTHGESHCDRIKTGVMRVASLWWVKDGNEADFEAFCNKQFIADAEELKATTRKVDKGLQSLRGHLHRINREIRLPFTRSDLEPSPVDDLLDQSIPETDYFASKLAFFIALNFPQYSLNQMLVQGPQWNKHQWAAARIGEMFTDRIPLDIANEAARYGKGKKEYFQNYFIHMDRVLTPEKKIVFPEGLKLNCHHGLRRAWSGSK